MKTLGQWYRAGRTDEMTRSYQRAPEDGKTTREELEAYCDGRSDVKKERART